MNQLMRLVYQTLTHSLPCKVARAWPQEDPGLPSLSFRLKDWQKQEDGSATARLHVLARANNPRQADWLCETCEEALLPLGLNLVRASDEVEAHTGHFLKSMDYETELWQGAIQPLRLHVLTGGAWQPLPFQTSIQAEPARAQLAAQAGLLLGQGLPMPIRLLPGTLEIKGPYDKEDPAQAALVDAFYAGSLLPLRLSRGMAQESAHTGCVVALSCLASGFLARVQLCKEGA